ncbi:MAG: hypothetical protein GY913_14315 [Proteobacteria bacterium]|nr:hypothetical protein [Pseudomonadota bacterium]MCP4918083.1 hypothetical protein [Pseudomonadota bacterium]
MLLAALALLACTPTVTYDPVADAGLDLVVAPGMQAVIEGAGIDADGAVTEYEWTLITSPTASTSTVSASGPQAAITPDLTGTYTLGLTVVDDDGNRSTMDIVNVHAQTANGMPTASIVGTGTLRVGKSLTLDASASSDPDGDPLRYKWSVLVAPANSAAAIEATGEVPYADFVPDEPGLYILGVEVDDGTSLSTRADLEIHPDYDANEGPVAVCPGAVEGNVGSELNLNGTSSYDPDGGSLAYAWGITEAPQGSTATIQNDTVQIAKFTPDVDGVWRMTLSVDDGQLGSAPCEFTVKAGDPAGNHAPVADAGDDIDGAVDTLSALDGSASYDPDGDTLSWDWSFLSLPADSTLTDGNIGNRDTNTAAVTPDVPGSYRLLLEACDDGGLCDTDTTTISVIDTSNTPPVADAGPDQSVDVGEEADLDGSGSSDPDGDTLSYTWTLGATPAGSSATSADIGGASSELATFTPDVDGTFELRLEVCDASDCDIDATLVTAGSGGNTPPVADAGSDATASTGSQVTMNGSGSYDVDGDSLTYRWGFKSVPSGSSITNDDWTDRATTSGKFTPDVAGDYEIRLTVNDGTDESSDLVTVTVSNGGNSAPVVDAGPDATGSTGTEVTMDGSGTSDPDGDSLTYRWGFKSVPGSSSLTNSDWTDRTTTAGKFTPDVSGDYEIRLTANDGTVDGSDLVTVTVSSGGNTAPVADAGSDETVSTGSEVTMDGSGSYDPDGDSVTYRWGFKSVPSGSSITNSDWTDRNTTAGKFTPDVSGDYEVRIYVDDGTVESNDLAVVTATGGGAPNTAPAADAGSDVEGCLLTNVPLNANGSTDADGDALSYTWSFQSIPSTSSLTDSDINGRWRPKPDFDPDVLGTYTLEVEADDGTDIGTDTVDVVFDEDDAVLVMHLDEESGATATDSSQYGLDGDVAVEDWTGGMHFAALGFDGTNVVTVPDDDLLDLTSGWSAELWVRAEPMGTADFQALFVKPINSSTSYAYSLFRYGDDTLAFYGEDTSGAINYAFVTGSSIGDGAWHHVVVNVTSGDDVEIYEDGGLIGSATWSTPLTTSTDDLEIGAWDSLGLYYFEGVIDELILRERTLSTAEVSSRYGTTEQFCTGDEDVDAPTVVITSPSSGAEASVGFAVVEGTASDESAIAFLSVNGQDAIATSANYGTWVAYVALADGTNTLTVDVEDIVGNADSNADSVDVDWSDDCYDDHAVVLTFDEDEGGVAYDATSSALDGSGSGTDRMAGVFGNAVTFDGTGGVTIPHDSSLSSGAKFSLDFWMASDATSSQEVVVHKGTYDYGCIVDGSDLYCSVTDTSGATWTLPAYGVADGAWHHVAVVFNTTYLRLYVDGALEDRVAVGLETDTNTDDVVLGEYGPLAGFEFNGALDHVRFQSAALTASDVADVYSDTEQCAVGENLAPTGTASASSEATTSLVAENVIDEDLSEATTSDTTYWLASRGTTGWVEVDLGSVVGVTQLRWANTHNGPSADLATDAYELAVSVTGAFDGEETIVDSGNGEIEDPLRFHQVDLTDPVAGQYVRFYVDGYHGSAGGLNELEIRGVE